jgi:hypothetical protein
VGKEATEIKAIEPLSDKDLKTLLLKFILLEGEDSIAAFSTWERLVVFDDASFQSFKLLSAVYPKLLKHDISSRLFLRIKGAHRRTWTENQLLLAQLTDLFADLNARRINFIIADEAFRLTEIYEDPGIFSLQNFSVIAPIRQKKEFCGRLIEHLWETGEDGVVRTSFIKDKSLAINIVWVDDKKFEQLLKEADTAVVRDSGYPIVRPEEQILNLCENRFLIHGDEESDWQFIACALFKSGKINSPTLIEFAKRRHLTHELAGMIDALAADFDVRVPTDLLAELRKRRRFGRVLSLERRIKNLSQDYQIFLEYETREESKAGFIEFLERRWGVDSYGDLIRHGVRSCIRLLKPDKPQVLL